ncbi:MAG: TPM domain-containing protein [Saprospiraceae bacterium]|nr:TPM domain-containing protein [Saprospiraceae bacterium]
MRIIIILLLAFVYSAISAQYTIETVPNIKLVNNSYISDPDDYIKSDTELKIDSLCKLVEDSVKAQIAVVVLNSIGNAIPNDFGTRLFNHWGIGNASTDNGLLILLVMDIRRVEFITGDGTEGVMPDALCYKIQQNKMVPSFKLGDYDSGLLDGVAASAEVLLKNEIYSPPVVKPYKPYQYNDDIHHESTFTIVLLFYSTFIIVPFTLLFLLLLFFTLFTRDYYRKYKCIKLFELNIFRILIPIPFLVVHILVLRLIEYWRNAPRFSAKTGALMKRMSEKEDDKYLKPGQIKEELVKSIDYDVWVGQDEKDIVILPYVKWFTGFSKCPKCKHKTYQLDYNKTTLSPTYSRSGRGEKKYSCKNCGHSVLRTYTIAKLTQSSTSSSSYSGGSSGGSWGGGSSSGGGAGSSW